MQIPVWIFLGLISGGIVAITLHDTRKFVMFLDFVLGAVGALLGGILTNTFTLQNVVGLYDETILLAVIGAGILIWIGRTIIMKNSAIKE